MRPYLGDLPGEPPVYRPTVMVKRTRHVLLAVLAVAIYLLMFVWVWPSLPRAQTFEQRVIHDCSPDARRLCSRAILKGKQAIIACMIEHKDKLGKRCRAHFWE